MDRFYVRAPSVNAVRRALGRAPGGVRVIGRFDRETIECAHTMEEHSLARHWPIVVGRLTGAGLAVVEKPAVGPADRPHVEPARPP
jgi:hypothetical protein